MKMIFFLWSEAAIAFCDQKPQHFLKFTDEYSYHSYLWPEVTRFTISQIGTVTNLKTVLVLLMTHCGIESHSVIEVD